MANNDNPFSYTIVFSQGEKSVEFASLTGIDEALQLVSALNASSNKPHTIKVLDSNGTILLNIPKE